MVTGTFKHTSGEVYDPILASEREPIGVTGTHPFWSVDREGWVSVLDLEIGETLKTLKGKTVIESRVRRPGSEPVYNIEVEGDHVYRVGESGVLVHNNSANIVPNASNSPSSYVATDCKDSTGTYKISGSMSSGEVRFIIRANKDPTARAAGSVTGEEFFDAMMDHFKGATSIVGVWLDEDDIRDNLDTYNRERAAGKSPKYAAFSTLTGRMAKRHKFDKISGDVFETPDTGPPFEDVRVWFTK